MQAVTDARAEIEQARERWNHFAPGSFNWCVERVDLGEPEVSRIVRVVCADQTIWPEQLLGRSAAGGAVSRPKSPPLATGHSTVPRRERRFAFARRLVWRASFELTDLSIENMAELVGGYRPATVRPWALSWTPFWKAEGEKWWSHWGPRFVDLLGCEMPPDLIEAIEARALARFDAEAHRQ